jgi:hypothetical protein
MESIRKGLAGLLAILVILTALPAQVLFNLERKAFTTETYQQAFANDDFYARLPSILAESVHTASTQDLPVAMQGLSQENWEAFFRDLLPPDTLKLMGDQALASVLAYVNDQGSSAVLSLTPLKERMAGEAGVQAVLHLMQTQPACTLDEIARITMALLNSQAISLCSPPENLYPLVLPVIQGQMQVAAAAVPAEVTLAQADGAAGKPDPRDRIGVARLVMRLSPILPLALLLLLTIIAVRSLRDWMLWWGAPLLITGLLGAITAWLGAPLARVLLLQLLERTLPDLLPSVLLASGSQLAAAIVDQLLRPTLIQGLVMLALGGAMLGLTALFSFLRRRDVAH